MKRTDPVKHLRAECERVIEQLRKIQCIPVKAAAQTLGISAREVREKLPVKILGPKTHRVSMADIDAFLEKRTVRP